MHMDSTDCKKRVKQEISTYRYAHALRTAEVALRLAERFGIDHDSAEIAALWHDFAREWDIAEILRYVMEANQSAGIEIYSEEKNNPMLLHGAAAAFALKDFKGVLSEEIFQAIRWHTVGSPEMGRLGYVLYIADFIEAGRSHISDAEKLRIESLLSIESMMINIVSSILEHLAGSGKPQHPATRALYRFLTSKEGR